MITYDSINEPLKGRAAANQLPKESGNISAPLKEKKVIENIQQLAAASEKYRALQKADSFINNSSRLIIQRQQIKSIDAAAKQKNRTGLPDKFKMSLEQLSGYSLNDVKVHYNSLKPARINALAYTQGNQIHLAPGQEKYLPHEAWHIIQQKQRRVQPTMQLKGFMINDNSLLEKEADIMGQKAIDRSLSYPRQSLMNISNVDKAPVQCSSCIIQREVYPAHIGRLRDAGVLFTEANLVFTVSTPDITPQTGADNIVFLEQGNANAGLQHIRTRHIENNQFHDVQVTGNVADWLEAQITGGAERRENAARNSTLAYYPAPDGEHHIKVTIGSNGFIVTAYPVTL